jgi:hypothetical protein
MSSWRSVNNACVYGGAQQKAAAFSGDKMQLVQINRTKRVARPLAYVFDEKSSSDRGPRSTLEPVSFPDIVHGAHGVLYGFMTQP